MSADPADISIVVHWHCGCYVGQSKWRRGLVDWEYEPDECDTDFDTEDTMDRWNEAYCSATRPTCGAELTQKFDDPTMTVIQSLPT